MNPLFWFLILSLLMVIAHIWIFIIDITAGVLSIAIVLIFAVMMGVMLKYIIDCCKDELNHDENDELTEYEDI